MLQPLGLQHGVWYSTPAAGQGRVAISGIGSLQEMKSISGVNLQCPYQVTAGKTLNFYRDFPKFLPTFLGDFTDISR